MSSVVQLPDGGKIVKTNCFECHAKCGVLCEVDKNGKLVGVKGNPEDPRSQGRMCAKGLAAPKILYDPDRLRYPLRRKAGTPRGSGQWDRITWDEAIEWLAQRIEEICDKYGAEAVAYGQGTGRGTNQWTSRSSNAGGAVNHSLSPGNICLVPMMVQSILQFGMFPIFDGVDFDNSDCIVMWGCNTMWTEATYTSGQVGRSRDRGAKLIVIDPFFEHPLAAKADHFVGLRPGSDTYLAMAWLNVIMNEGLYDEYFTKKFTNAPMLIIEGVNAPLNEALVKEGGNQQVMLFMGKDGQLHPLQERTDEVELEYRGTVIGADGNPIPVKTVWIGLKEIADEWTPEAAAEKCWCPAEVIRESARTYATAPSACIEVFQGIEEQTNCRDSIQLINIIIAICGNLEKKGGNLSMPFWNQMFTLSGANPETHEEKRLKDERAAGTFNGSSNTAMCFEAMKTGKPYPIKGYIHVQGNPLSWSEDTKKVREGLMNLDLLCTMDYYMSPTAQLADLVLPSTHWTERDYLADEVCSEWVFAQQHAVEPLYERRSDVWFWRTLGRRLHPDWWPWETDDELFEWQLEQTHAGITWNELKEQWIHHVPQMPSRDYEKKRHRGTHGHRPRRAVFYGRPHKRAEPVSQRERAETKRVRHTRNCRGIPADRRHGAPLSSLLPLGVPRHSAAARNRSRPAGHVPPERSRRAGHCVWRLVLCGKPDRAHRNESTPHGRPRSSYMRDSAWMVARMQGARQGRLPQRHVQRQRAHLKQVLQQRIHDARPALDACSHR